MSEALSSPKKPEFHEQELADIVELAQLIREQMEPFVTTQLDDETSDAMVQQLAHSAELLRPTQRLEARTIGFAMLAGAYKQAGATNGMLGLLSADAVIDRTLVTKFARANARRTAMRAVYTPQKAANADFIEAQMILSDNDTASGSINDVAQLAFVVGLAATAEKAEQDNVALANEALSQLLQHARHAN